MSSETHKFDGEDMEENCIVDILDNKLNSIADESMEFMMGLDVPNEMKKPIQMYFGMSSSRNFLMMFDPESEELDKINMVLGALREMLSVTYKEYKAGNL